MVVTEAFEEIARATLESRGRPDHPLVVLPHDTEFTTGERLEGYAEKAVRESFGVPKPGDAS